MPEKPPAPSDLADKFMLRLPDGMRDRIKAAAEAANRSMNAEIVATLEREYPAPLPTDPDELIALYARSLGFDPANLTYEQVNQMRDNILTEMERLTGKPAHLPGFDEQEP